MLWLSFVIKTSFLFRPTLIYHGLDSAISPILLLCFVLFSCSYKVDGSWLVLVCYLLPSANSATCTLLQLNWYDIHLQCVWGFLVCHTCKQLGFSVNLAVVRFDLIMNLIRCWCFIQMLFQFTFLSVTQSSFCSSLVHAGLGWRRNTGHGVSSH